MGSCIAFLLIQHEKGRAFQKEKSCIETKKKESDLLSSLTFLASLGINRQVTFLSE